MHQWLLWLLWLHWYCCALVLVLVLVLIKSLLISMLLCSGLLSSFIILPSLCVNTIPLYFLDALQALAIQPKYFVLFVFQSVDSKSSSYLVHCLSDIAQLLWTFWVELSCYVVHSLAHMPLIIICNVYCSCILIWLICYMEECIWSLSGKRFNQPQYVSEAVFWKSMCWQLLLLSPYPSQCIFPHWDKFISSCNICVYALLLKGIEYNSSTKGKYPNIKEIVSTGSTENCESEKWDTEVEKDKKVSFDNVTNAGWI